MKKCESVWMGTFNIREQVHFDVRCHSTYVYICRSLPIQRIHIRIKSFILINVQCSTALCVRCSAEYKRTYRKQMCDIEQITKKKRIGKLIHLPPGWSSLSIVCEYHLRGSEWAAQAHAHSILTRSLV